MGLKTVRDAIEKLQTLDPNMLIGSNHSDSWGAWFCELQFSEEFINEDTKLYDRETPLYPTKVLVIY